MKFKIEKSCGGGQGGLWYVVANGSGFEGSLYVYLHTDGKVREFDYPLATSKVWFKTRQAARNAVKRYRMWEAAQKKKTNPKKAVVSRGLDSKECLTHIRFVIEDGPFGSEPILDRGYEATLIQIGMVLKHYGVNEFEFKG